MKKLVLLLIIPFITISFMSCSSAQISKKAPFKIHKAYYQGLIDNKGKLFTIEFVNTIPEDITIDSIYFQGKKNKVTLSANAKKLTTVFINNTFIDNNLVLDKDPKKEFGNKPPTKKEKIPFNLSENEFIISYFYKGKKQYFKASSLQKEGLIKYP